MLHVSAYICKNIDKFSNKSNLEINEKGTASSQYVIDLLQVYKHFIVYV